MRNLAQQMAKGNPFMARRLYFALDEMASRVKEGELLLATFYNCVTGKAATSVLTLFVRKGMCQRQLLIFRSFCNYRVGIRQSIDQIGKTAGTTTRFRCTEGDE